MHHIHLTLLASLLALSSCTQATATTTPEADAAARLVKRIAPDAAAQFRFETIPADNGGDVYEIDRAPDGKVVLRGNSTVSMASAFRRYLADEAHCQVTWNGDNLTLPSSLPAVDAKVRTTSPFKVRFAYNYCTYGYTMPWWNERQWQRELDWLALHGFTHFLLVPGQELVWQRTFQRFGYSAEEIRNWLCSPVHQPWQFMQNMEGVCPPPQSLINNRAELCRRQIARARELGIEPVMQGWYGMLPSGFAKKHPGARIVGQGTWAGGNRRPDMLHVDDPLFEAIGKAFLEEQEKLYGRGRCFAADPFHEGGQSGDMKRGHVYKRVQDIILARNPDAIVVKQCWQTSNKEMFDAGQRNRSLALDLWCENKPFWKHANGYEGTPWVWCHLGNFGGNMGLEAPFHRIVRDFRDLLADPARRNLVGTAIVPEGSQQNPMIYELMADLSWSGAPADAKAWVASYLHARYGRDNTSAKAAWDHIIATAYDVDGSEAPYNSIITARPSIGENLKGRTWSRGSDKPYDNKRLAQAWPLLLQASREIGPSDTLEYDLADVSRQVLANLASTYLKRTFEAYKAKDAKAFRKNAGSLLELMSDIDKLCATRREWLIGAWIADARAWGRSSEEKAYCERMARMILTTWIENPQTDLADYANREWSGLVSGYYLPRWKRFLESLDKSLASGKPFDQGAFNKERAAMDERWVKGRTTYPATPTGKTVEVSTALWQKYSGDLQ